MPIGTGSITASGFDIGYKYTTPIPITKLECKSRVVDVRNNGTEITRIFYVEPYEAHVTLISQLLGSLNDVGTRFPPCNDGYLDYCFCAQATVESFHEAAMLGSPSLMALPDGTQAIPPNTQTADRSTIRSVVGNLEKPHGTPNPNGTGNCGAYVRAIFKPMSFASAGTGTGLGVWDTTRFEKWDMVNPVFAPITKVCSTGKQIKILVKDLLTEAGGRFPYPGTDSDGFVTQGMETFTLQRRMVRFPPFQTIRCLKNKVNFNSLAFKDPNGFNHIFAQGCLRFDDATIEPVIVPDVTGGANYFYNITYQFTHNSIYDEYWDNTAKIYKKGFVTWNRILCCPTNIFGMPIRLTSTPRDPDGYAHTSYYDVGWKSSVFGGVHALYPYDTDAVIDGVNPITGAAVSLSAQTFQALFYKGMP